MGSKRKTGIFLTGCKSFVTIYQLKEVTPSREW